MVSTRNTSAVLGTAIDVTTYASTCDRIFELASAREGSYVCFATAHMLVEATRDRSIARAYGEAAQVNPDGTPVAWCLRLMGHAGADCVSGPRTVPRLLERAESCGIAVGFYGGRPETLRLMMNVLSRDYPKLQVGYMQSPPFRPLSAAEQQNDLDDINASGIKLLFIGLGSPKQERWMNQYNPLLNCVCLGVGAAFEFLSGEKAMPPVWLQKMGLAWLVRLCQEPRRLARRNLYSPVFAAMFFRQLITGFNFGFSSPGGVVSESEGE
jgi:N-acetylglucosaminyldiphosphoundecaprenol N-acetyl-beta-D-mannosaminyltransferase